MTLRLAAALLAAWAAAASAQTFTWTGNGGLPDWSVPLNWSGGVAPTSGIDTVVRLLNPTVQAVSNQNVAVPFLLNELRFNNDLGSFTLNGQDLEFRVNSGGANPQLRFGGANDGYTNPCFIVASGELLVTGPGGSAPGSGRLNVNGPVIGAGDLHIAGNSNWNGTISNTGRVLISTNSPFANLNGTIAAGGGNVIVENLATLGGTGTINRTLQHDGNGRINTAGTLTVNAAYNVVGATADFNGGTLAVAGLTTITGLLQANSGSNLVGAGSVRIEDGGAWHLYSGATATKEVELVAGILFPVFRGGGTLHGNVNVASHGAVEAALGGDNLTIDGTVTFGASATESQLNAVNANTLTIVGTTTVANGAIVRLRGDLAGAGAIQVNAGGEARLDLADLAATKAVTVSGLLRSAGGGTVHGAVALAGGTINGDTGLTLAGTLTSTGSAALQGVVDLGGTTTVQSGTLNLVAGATLGGAGGLTIASGAAMVANGAVNKALTVRGTFDGDNSVSQAVTLEAGKLSSAGTLTLADTLTIQTAGTSQLLAGTVNVAGLTTVAAGRFGILLPALLSGAGALHVASGGVLDLQGEAAKNVTVMSGGRIEGNGVVSGGLLTVAAGGTLAPGNSTGTITGRGGIRIDGDYLAEIDDDGVGPLVAGVDFDQLIVAGGLFSVGPNSRVLISFGSRANFSDPYWYSAHEWKIVDVPSGLENIQSYWTRSQIVALNGPFGADQFDFRLSENPGIFLTFAPTAVPEPGALALAALAAGLWHVGRRRTARATAA